MPNDFTYMWNLKNKINEQTELKQTHRHRVDWSLWAGLGGWEKKAEGTRSTNS